MMQKERYLIGYLDDVIRQLVLILPKISEYVKTFKGKNNKLMFFRRDDDKLLEKYKTIQGKTEDLNKIELNALPVYDGRYTKTEINTYDDNVYANFRDSNVPKDGVESESFTIIFIDSLLVYESKYYLQLYLDKCTYKIIKMQMIDYLNDNLLASDENYSYK